MTLFGIPVIVSADIPPGSFGFLNQRRWKRANAIAQECAFGPVAIYALLEDVKDDEEKTRAVIRVASARSVSNILAVAAEVTA